MQIFITGTDTNVGKTLVSSWLASHTKSPYWKPIQTGLREGSDSCEVQRLADVLIYPERYAYVEPLSPHLAAEIAGDVIDMSCIVLPTAGDVIVEGAGGVLVPINQKYLMVDLMAQLGIPVILVARTTLGTINHTLLSLEALRARDIRVMGVVLNGQENPENSHAIAVYGQTTILATVPQLSCISQAALKNIPLSPQLMNTMGMEYR